MNEIEEHLAKTVHPMSECKGEKEDVVNLNSDVAPASDDIVCINVVYARDDILPEDVDPDQGDEQQATVPHEEPCFGVIVRCNFFGHVVIPKGVEQIL